MSAIRVYMGTFIIYVLEQSFVPSNKFNPYVTHKAELYPQLVRILKTIVLCKAYGEDGVTHFRLES